MTKTLFIWGSRLLFAGSTILSLSIVSYLLYRGVASFDIGIVSNELVGAIVGTLELVVMSVLIALPLGVATGIYIDSYAQGKFRAVLSFVFEILASVPSILIGLFGFSVLLFLHNYFPDFKTSLFLASFSLSILIMPYIIKATQTGFSDTPKEQISIGYALGASKERIIISIKLRYAVRYIAGGVFLSIARAAEDTAVIMMTGAVANYGISYDLFAPFEALPFYIYYTSSNYDSVEQLNSIFVASLILVLISSLLIFITKSGSKRLKRHL